MARAPWGLSILLYVLAAAASAYGVIIGTNNDGSIYAGAVMGLATCANLNRPFYSSAAMPVLPSSPGYVGLRNGPGSGYLAGAYTSTEQGSLCEGWGVSGTMASSNLAIYANECRGTNCPIRSMLSQSDTSAVIEARDSSGKIKVTHSVAPSMLSDHMRADGVFVVEVTIKNLDSANDLRNVRYRRVMDW